MRRLVNTRAQSTAEYAVVIAIVLGAVIGMQTYVKRGLQGRYKDVTQTFTNAGGAAFQSKQQYEPYYASSDTKTKVTTDYTEDMAVRDQVTRNNIVNGQTRLSGSKQDESGFSAPGGSWQ